MSELSNQEKVEVAINHVRYLLNVGYDQKTVDQMKIYDRLSTPFDLYHVSWNNDIKYFIPRCSRFVLADESVVLPHVSTSQSLIGCLIGINFRKDKNLDKTLASIYKLDWLVSVVPPVKLLPDVRRTSEHWLLPISPDSRNHRGTIIGQYFISHESFQATKSREIHSAIYYLRVMMDKFTLYPGYILNRGHYKVIIKDTYQLTRNGVDESQNHVHCTEITPQEYQRRYMLRNLDDNEG